MLDGPREVAVDVMVFKTAAFSNGRVPNLSQRIDIAFADLTYRFRRATDGNSGAVEGSEVQKTVAMRRSHSGSFYVPGLLFPPGAVSFFLHFSINVVASNSDVRLTMHTKKSYTIYYRL